MWEGRRSQSFPQMESCVFIIWSIDDKVDCSAAVVPKDLSLAGFCFATICWGLDGLGPSSPVIPAPPPPSPGPRPRNSALELDCLGSKPSTASCVAFGKLLPSVSISLHLGLIYYLSHGVIVKIKKHTQCIWSRDSYTYHLGRIGYFDK